MYAKWQSKRALNKAKGGEFPLKAEEAFLLLWRFAGFVEVLVDLAPAWEAAEVAVVYEEVGVDFAADVGRVGIFFWVRAVDGVGRDATFF